MVKMRNDSQSEKRLVNDAIQFWKGYLEALIWAQSLLNDKIENLSDEFRIQYEFASKEFDSFKLRYRELNERKKNARRSQRD